MTITVDKTRKEYTDYDVIEYCYDVIEYCCNELEEAFHSGWINFNIELQAFVPNSGRQERLPYCAYCGKKLEYHYKIRSYASGIPPA